MTVREQFWATFMARANAAAREAILFSRAGNSGLAVVRRRDARQLRAWAREALRSA